MAQTPRKISAHTLRLTYGYDRTGAIRLIDARRVRMVPPVADDATKAAPDSRSGFWYEVRDRDGTALYRRTISHPLLDALEVPTDEPHGMTHGQPGARGGEFTLLVPDLANAAAIAVYGTPLEENVMAAARELVRTPLAEIEERLKR